MQTTCLPVTLNLLKYVARVLSLHQHKFLLTVLVGNAPTINSILP